MNSEKINQLLKSAPRKYTYAEIEQMMDEELAKDPSEMDTDFIDFCADLLCKALDARKEKELNTRSDNKKRIKLKLTKIIAAALITILILGGAMTVSAKYVYNDTSDKIVKFYADHFSINLRGTNSNTDTQIENSADLIAKLKDNGFDKIILPTLLLTDEYTYDVNITEDEKFLTAYVDFNNISNNTVFGATITKYKNGISTFLNSDIQMTANYDSAKQLSLNGMDVFVFGNKECSTIMYIDNNTRYYLELKDLQFDSAVEIAESIK